MPDDTPSRPQQQHSAVVTLQVPSSFLCPIHLEIMADPVTLYTGITYDRVSIETWLTAGHNTCPVTNQPLLHHDLIPNHALRNAMFTWCTANPSPAGERIREQIHAPKTVELHVELTTLLHNIADCNTNHLSSSLQRVSTVLTQLDDEDKRALFADSKLSNSTLAARLCCILSSTSLGGSSTSSAIKVNAAEILHTLCEQDPTHVTRAHPVEVIKGLATLMKDKSLTSTSVTAGLKCLLSLCQCKKTHIVAIECDAVSVLMDLIIYRRDNRRNVEICCGILEMLANCAEGRDAIRKHPFGVARVVESLLGLSDVATEHAVGALYGVLALAADRRSVMNVAMQAGVFKRLLMVMSSECSPRAKGKAREMLKMLIEVCGGNPRSAYVAAAQDCCGVVIKRRREYNSDSLPSGVIDCRRPL